MASDQSTATTPYNPLWQCYYVKRFNHILFALMRTLTGEQKPNWPTYVPIFGVCLQFHSLMHRQDFSHTNLCSGAKLQHLVMIGWAWHITSQTVLSLKLFG